MKVTKTTLGTFAIILALGFSLTSCKQDNREQEKDDQDLQIESKTEDTFQRIYRAEISSLNESANGDRSVSGSITLQVQGDRLLIDVEASGLEPNTMHLQHLHGAPEGGDTNCPEMGADSNNDDLVDITEAYNVAGVTMIPFHDNPSNMEVDTDTYPTADENGNISYQQTVDLDELTRSFKGKFQWENLDFNNFTYLIHGVQDTEVPETVESVKGLPAHVTLPVGCAKLTEE